MLWVTSNLDLWKTKECLGSYWNFATLPMTNELLCMCTYVHLSRVRLCVLAYGVRLGALWATESHKWSRIFEVHWKAASLLFTTLNSPLWTQMLRMKCLGSLRTLNRQSENLDSCCHCRTKTQRHMLTVREGSMASFPLSFCEFRFGLVPDSTCVFAFNQV